MKWKYPRDVETLVKGPATAFPPLALFYGDDSGQIRTLALKMATAVAPDINDPFATDRLTPDDLATPGRLRDSAGTVPFGGGLRLVRLEGVMGDLDRGTQNAVLEAVTVYLDDAPPGAVVVVQAPGMDKDAALVKLVEKHPKAHALRLYVDNARGLESALLEVCRREGKTLHPDALTFLKENLGNDRGVTDSEMTKICLYAGDAKEITFDHALAALSAAPSVNVFKLCDAIGLRDARTADRLLHELAEEGADPLPIAAAVLRHLRRLADIKAHMARGLTPDEAMSQLRPPVLVGKDELARQARTYPEARLKQASERLFRFQVDTRQNGLPAELVLHRIVLGLSA